LYGVQKSKVEFITKLSTISSQPKIQSISPMQNVLLASSKLYNTCSKTLEKKLYSTTKYSYFPLIDICSKAEPNGYGKNLTAIIMSVVRAIW